MTIILYRFCTIAIISGFYTNKCCLKKRLRCLGTFYFMNNNIYQAGGGGGKTMENNGKVAKL